MSQPQNPANPHDPAADRETPKPAGQTAGPGAREAGDTKRTDENSTHKGGATGTGGPGGTGGSVL